MPAVNFSVFQGRGNAVVIDRPIEIVLDIFLSCPHHLDRPIDLLGDADGFDDHVGLKPATEAAADDLVVDDYFVERNAGRGCRGRLHARLDLGTEPDFASTRRQMHGAIHRFHGGMRQEGHFVMRLDFFTVRQRLVGIADLLGDEAALLAGRLYLFPDQSRVDAAVDARVPRDDERIETALGGPHMVADHRHHIVQHDNLLHTGNFLCRAVVDMADFAAKNRARRDGGELQAGQHHIDAIDFLAVDFGGSIQPLQRLADQLEILRRFQGRIGRRRATCLIRQFAITERTVARLMHDNPVLGRAGRGIDVPLFRGGRDQQCPRARGGFAQWSPEGADRIGIAGGLHPQHRIGIQFFVGRRGFKYDLGPIGVQLLRDDHGNGGKNALSHFNLRHDQCRLAGSVDANEGVG